VLGIVHPSLAGGGPLVSSGKRPRKKCGLCTALTLIVFLLEVGQTRYSLQGHMR